MKTNIEAMEAIINLEEVRNEVDDVKKEKMVTNLIVAGTTAVMIASCAVTRNFNHVAGVFGVISLLAGSYSMVLTSDLSDLNSLDKTISRELIKSITPNNEKVNVKK